MKNINKETIRSYLQKLHQRGESLSLILKKLTIVDKFINWAYQNNLINEDAFKQIKEEIDKENLKLKIKNEKLQFKIKNLTSNIKNKFQELISKFKTKPISTDFNPSTSLKINHFQSFDFAQDKPFSTKLGIHHYIGLLFILIFLGFLGAGLYNKFFLKVERPLAYPSSLTRGGRVLSFQGRLTDSLGNPITTATNVQFKLYNVSTGGTALYTAGPCSITPDQDGIFSTLIGSNCGSEIPHSVFTENPNIYLGVTVGADSEMTPRQPIANVGYAINAETLQGFPPGEGTSNIPFINKDGDLLIAVASPGIRSTFASADFTLSSAKAAVIQSAGSGDVVLQATESGTLKFRTGGDNDAFNRMVIDNNGLVGIGLTPSQKLEVSGNIYANSGQIRLGNFASAPTAIGAGSLYYDSTATKVYYYNGSAWTEMGAGSGGSSWWTQNLGLLYPINSTLDLAIGGTATSSAKFAFTNVLTGTPTATFSGNLVLASDAGTSRTIGATNMNPLTLGTSTTGNLVFAPVGSTAMTILQNGNVGIGTTNPSQNLHISGNMRLTGALYDVNNEPGTSGQILSSTGSGVDWIDPGIIPIRWSSLTDPTANLSLNHNEYTTTFTWNTAATAASFNGLTLAITNDATTDTNTQRLLVLQNNSTTGGTTENLLYLNNADNNAVTSAIVIDNTGGGGFTNFLDTPSIDITGTGAITGATGISSSGTINFSGLTANRLVTTDASSNLTTSISSSNVAASVTDETGSGLLVFGTSPTFSTSVVTDSTSFNVFNTTATTINAFGAATTLNIGGSSGTATIGNSTLSLPNATSVIIAGNSAVLNFSSNTGVKQIQTGGSTHLALMPGGNVGIGTTAPSALLDVTRPNTTDNTELVSIRSGGFTQTISAAVSNARYNQFLAPTLTASSAQTVTDATTLFIERPPIAGSNVTITNASSLLFGSATDQLILIQRGGGRRLTIQAGGATSGSSDSAGGELRLSSGISTGNAASFISFYTATAGGTGSTDRIPSEKMRIDGAGNVGIGTTSPGQKLSVNGGLAASYFYDYENNNYGIDPAGTANFGGYSLKITGGALLAADSGNVGIGLTNPAYKLDITDSSTTRGINVLNTTASSYGVYAVGTSYGVYGSDGTTAGYLGYNDQYGLYTPNNAYVGGNLYSGNHYPLSTNAYDLGSTSAQWNSLYLADGTGLTAGGGLFFGASQNFLLTYDAATDLSLKLTDGTNTFLSVKDQGTAADFAFNNNGFWIGNNGNVGIGTTSPGAKLDIAGSTSTITNTSGDIVISAASGNVSLNGGKLINFSQAQGGSGTTSAPTYSFSSSTNTGMYLANTGVLGFATGGTNRMVIDSSGNVGIGTTGPASKFHLMWSDAGATGQRFSDAAIFENNGNVFLQLIGSAAGEKSINFAKPTNGADGAIKYNYSSVPNGFSFWTNGNNFRMAIDQNGNVGIGTTAPGYLLDLSGGSINVSHTAAQTRYSKSNGTSVSRTGTDANGAFVTSDTPGLSMIFYTTPTGGSLTERIRITADGNVGIGTTGPESKLHVVGSSRFSGNIIHTSGVNALGSNFSLVPNAGFEVNDDSTTTIADSWTGSTVGNASFGIDSSTPAQGNYSQQLIVSTAGAGNYAVVRSMCFPIMSNRYYNLSASAKASVNTTSGFYLRLEAYSNLTNCQNATSPTNIDAASNIGLSTSYSIIYYGNFLPSSTGNNTWGRVSIYNYQPNVANTTTVDNIALYPINASAGTGIDLAETYPVSQDNTPQAGHLVKISNNISPETQIAFAEKTTNSYDANIFGIVSTKPEITFDDGREYLKSKIALSGRVPAIVSTENGTINTGDPITSSSLPGIGMLATKSSYTVGKALQSTKDWNTGNCPNVNNINEINWPNDDGTNSAKPCFHLPNGTFVGKIMVFVNLSWYEPPTVILTSIGDIQIVRTDGNGEDVYDGNLEKIRNSKFEIRNSLGEVIDRIGAFAEITAAKIKTGLLEAENAVVNNVLAAKNIVAENIQSLTLNVERLTASQKIISPIVETTNLVATGEASLKTIATNEIKPQNGDLVIDLNQNNNVETQSIASLPKTGDKGPLARLIIKGLEGKTAVVIDASGNASFSGTLTAQNLSAQNATISGNLATNTLNATEASISGKIIAKEVEAENINEIQRLLADIKNAPLPDPNYYQNIDSNVRVGSSDPNTGTNTAPLQMYGSGLPTLQDLTVTGQSNLYNVSVSDSLLVGSTIMENNSIIALASELRLSALDKITLFDGAVTIAKDGTITTKGTLIAQGGIKTNNISAVNEADDINIKLKTQNSKLKTTTENSKLNITDQLGNINASIDASGSAKFKELALEQFNPPTPEAVLIAAPDNFAKNGIFAPAIETATASAGIGFIPENQQEVIIYNDRVKNTSLIYLTPDGANSGDGLLTVGQKEDCSNTLDNSSCKKYFKVIKSASSTLPIKFNWLIIN